MKLCSLLKNNVLMDQFVIQTQIRKNYNKILIGQMIITLFNEIIQN